MSSPALKRVESKNAADRYNVETYVSWSPCEPSPMEEEAGQPSDLFPCFDSGHFFTVKNMRVETTARNVDTSKTFLCPVCPTSTPLNIMPSSVRMQQGNNEPVAKCDACGWDTSHCDVNDIGDLVQRAKMPYPWLDQYYRALQSNLVTSESSASASAGTGGESANANEHGDNVRLNMFRKKSLLVKRNRNRELEKENDKEKEDINTFTKRQEIHEQKVFQSFTPERFVPKTFKDVSELIETGYKDMCKQTDSSELIEGDDRKANGIYLKRQLGPVLKVKAPYIASISPFSNNVMNERWEVMNFFIADDPNTASYVLPKVFFHAKSSSSSSATSLTSTMTTDLLCTIRNDKQIHSHVKLINWHDRSQVVLDMKLKPKEKSTTKLRNVNHLKRPIDYCKYPWFDTYNDNLIQFEMHITYDTKKDKSTQHKRQQSNLVEKWMKLCNKTWKICLFIRHK